MKIKRSALKLLLIGSLSLVLLTGIQLLGGTHGVSAAAAADSCTSTATDSGTDTMNLSVPSAGTYEIWTQMEIPSATDDGILMNVNKSADCFNVGDSSTIPTGSMQWINYSDGSTSNLIQVSLNAGDNSVELIGANGVQVGMIEALAPDSTCNPTVSGAACAPASVSPPTVAITAPAAGAPVNGEVKLTADAASAPGVSAVSIAQVAFEVNGKVVGTVTTAPYTFTWDSTSVVNGTYPVIAVATDTQNQSTPSASEDITVANNVCSADPGVPTGVKATATGSTTATVTWTAPAAASGCTISSYSIYENGSSVPIGTPSGSTTTADISGLSADTPYTFTVSATDNAGNPSVQSTAASVTTQSATSTTTSTSPTPPTSVSASAVSSTEVNLTWVASSSSDATGYYVFRNGDLLHVVSGSTSISYEDDTVAPDTSYVYKVSAYDSAGTSSQATATPDPVVTPSASSTGTGSSTTGTGSSTTGTGSSTTGKGSSTTGTGSSTSGKGSSTTTGTGKGKGTAPPPPTKPGAPVVSGSGVVITWGRGHHYNGRLAGWHIYENNRLVVSVTTGSGSGTSVTITGLSPNTKYTFYIVAYNTNAQTSSRSSSFHVTTEHSSRHGKR